MALFAKEFARARGNVLSSYDGTIETADIAPESPDPAGPDPVLDRSVPVLTSAFVRLCARRIELSHRFEYRLLNREVSRQLGLRDNSVAPGLCRRDGRSAAGARAEPGLGVLIVNGYTDLVTPYMTSRYLVGQIPSLPGAKPIRIDVLEGGHMMYFRPDGRSALKEAASELYPNDGMTR